MNQALEKLFDEMFQNVAMDISSDIQVLEVMLKQDGLTEDGIHADQKEPDSSYLRNLLSLFLYVHRSIQKVFRRRTGCLNIIFHLY